MILTGSTELNGLDAGLEKDALCTPGKNQELKKVNNTLFLYNWFLADLELWAQCGLGRVGKSKISSKSQIQSSQNVSLTLFVLEIAAKVVRHSRTQKNVRSKEHHLFFNF